MPIPPALTLANRVGSLTRILTHHGLVQGGLIALLLVGCTNDRAPLASQPTLKIGGSSETYDLLERLIAAYQTETSDSQFEFFPPSQTSGGIQGVKSAVIDIGGVSRIPSPDETDGQLVYLRLANAPLVVVVHESVTGITNITGAQIQAIYSGQITNWQALGGPDADIILFDFTEDESEKQLLRQTYLGQDLAITPDAVIFPEDDELPETAAITKYSMATIAYSDKLDDLALNPLSVDGISPSAKTLQSGEYPMRLSLGVVLNQQPSSVTQAFLDFATSPEGQKALSGTNYVPPSVN